jgi:hypothetical protein
LLFSSSTPCTKGTTKLLPAAAIDGSDVVSLIPGWDSIASAGWWSNFYFWAGIAGLLLLGVSEVVSHRYTERKDELVAEDQDATQRRHDEEMARLRVEAARLSAEADSARAAIANANTETAKANESAARANERAAQLKLTLEQEIAARQPRNITADEHARMVAYLQTARPKGAIVVIWKIFDEEAEQFAKKIIAVLKDAGFDTSEGNGPLSFGTPGQWIVVRDLKTFQSTPNAIGAIQGAFRDILHIEFDGVQRKDPWPDLGEVVIAVGRKQQ